MLIVDIVLLLLLLGFVGAGLKDGFVHTLGRLIGAVVGFVAARAWSLKLATIFAFFMPSAWAKLLAFILIFIFITRVVGLAFKLVDGVFEILSILPFLKSVNRLLGAILGFLEGFIILGGAIYVILGFKLEPHLVTWLSTSKIAPWILGVFHSVLGILL